jgi:hypothetical protein
MVAERQGGDDRLDQRSPMELPSMSTFVPAVILLFLGALFAVLGLLAAGSLELIVIGLAAIFGAGVLSLAESRA